MNDVETIKQRLDIADTIRDYVNLKQSGVHLKACCPFHHEKTPSFMVNRERQSWHCFGCNEGGDIFSFIQRIENIDFREALKLLAEKAGVELTGGQKSDLSKDERTRLLDVLTTTANVYHRVLREVPAAKIARDYLARRGVSEEMISKFQIGCAPTAWDALTKYLVGKGFNVDDCVKAGVTIRKEENNRTFDRFRARIMFPIADIHGRVIGFTGRVLVESKEAGGKYVNTPETPLFHKGNLVYGLNLAKPAIKENGYVVLVEGQMDVIACHQFGMANTVACSGTALTSDQLRLLKRYTDELRMAFDADAAGEHAAERSIQLALAEGFVVKIIRIPPGAGKDADECARKNLEVWKTAVANAQPFIADLVEHLVPPENRTKILADSRTKHTLSNRIAEFIALVPSAVERDHWIQHASLQLAVSPDVLTSLVNRLKAGKKVDAPAPEKTTARPAMMTLIEERLMALLQQEFSLWPRVAALVPPEYFADSSYAALYNNWADQYTVNQSLKNAPTTDPTLELLLSAVYPDFGSVERQTELIQLATRLQKFHIARERDELTQQIRLAEQAGELDRMRALVQRFQNLML